MESLKISAILFIFLFLISPAAAGVFVTDSSHTIMTAPAAAHTKSQFVVSSYNPEKSILKFLAGENVIVVGDIKVNGTRIPARTSALARYWNRSNVVVLGTGKDISAAYIAIKNDAPLLISGTTMPLATKNEIKRLKPKKIIICAPSSSIPSSSVKGLGIPYQRVWYGSDSSTLASVQPQSAVEVSAPRSLLPVAMVLWKNARFTVKNDVRVNGTLLWSSSAATTSVIMNRYAKGDPETIYISSDRLSGVDARLLMESIKRDIAGSARVIIDPKSPAPGEADRAIKNATPGGLAVYIAAACPGTIYSTVSGIKTGYLKTYASRLDGVVYVNYGNLNLGNTSYLPRAWDDNFSSVFFAGVYEPANYLRDAGILLVEPKLAPEDQRVHLTATRLIDYAYSTSGEHMKPLNSSKYVARHEIDPTTLASDAKNILNNEETTMNRQQWVYLASQYISGFPIKNSTATISEASSNVSSTYTGTLTRAEYRDIARRVSEFTRTNNRIPSYVQIGDKRLGSRDYTILFAQIIQNHTEKSYMVFPASVTVNGNIIDQVVEFLKDLIT